MSHELKHVQQYGRLGTLTFCTQYSLNAWIFENEAKNEQARVEAAMVQRAGGPMASQQQQYAYFLVTGNYLYADADGLLYPADTRDGRVLGPANGRVLFQNGQWVAVDMNGAHFAAQRIH
jgi:hypothetical protein